MRIFIADSSEEACRNLADRLKTTAKEILVVGTAGNTYDTMGRIMESEPDLLLLRLEEQIPQGIDFIKTIQEFRPMPVIALGSHFGPGSEESIGALKAGAFDVIQQLNPTWSDEKIAQELLPCIREASKFLDEFKGITPPLRDTRSTREIVDEKLALIRQRTSSRPQKASTAYTYHPRQIILIGASTGGTEAIRDVLLKLPSGLPPHLDRSTHSARFFEDVCQSAEHPVPH